MSIIKCIHTYIYNNKKNNEFRIYILDLKRIKLIVQFNLGFLESELKHKMIINLCVFELILKFISLD